MPPVREADREPEWEALLASTVGTPQAERAALRGLAERCHPLIHEVFPRAMAALGDPAATAPELWEAHQDLDRGLRGVKDARETRWADRVPPSAEPTGPDATTGLIAIPEKDATRFAVALAWQRDVVARFPAVRAEPWRIPVGVLPNFFPRRQLWAQDGDLTFRIAIFSCPLSENGAHPVQAGVWIESGWCVPSVLRVQRGAAPRSLGVELPRLARGLELDAALAQLGAFSIVVGFDGCAVTSPTSLVPAVELVQRITTRMRSFPLELRASDRDG
jgi:hypothetical protein